MSVSPAPAVKSQPLQKNQAGLKTRFVALTVGSVGVVYGDIGTSPLYAFREALVAATGGGLVTPDTVLGVLSLIFWSLILVVTLKYVILLLRADNNGEGGTLSLTALAFRALGRRATPVVILGMIGAAMFYGSSFITPALSVMSAIEGLKVATPRFEPYVLPLTVMILVALFAVQSRGTGKIAVFFGPLMVLWFVVIAVAGLIQVASHPGILAAVNPVYAISFLAQHTTVGLATLGFVLLAVTGGEALYADLGHFGRQPIQTAWFCLVLPALIINYFGQGALVLADPTAIQNPFYRLIPDLMLVPMVVLATAATAIASQAVITGSYSLTRQAIQLGFVPRLEVQHKSEEHHGQIFMPRVNWILLAGVILIRCAFPDLKCSGLGLWSGSGGSNAYRWISRIHRDPKTLALAAVVDHVYHGTADYHGHDVSGRNPDKLSCWRLGAGRDWRSALTPDGHLASWHNAAGTENASNRSSAQHVDNAA